MSGPPSQSLTSSTSSSTGPSKKYRSFLSICLSSIPAAAITNSCLVPFDVVKIRLQKASMASHTSKIGMLQMGRQIVKKEGIRTLLNGLSYSVLHSIGLNLSMLLGYQRFSHAVGENLTKHKVIQPMVTSICATSLSTFVTFPLEYWKTIQQSSEGVSHRAGFELGKRLYSAFFVCLQRNVGFFVIFWPINENSRRVLRTKVSFFDTARYSDNNGQLPMWKNFLVNWSSGIVSAAVAGVATQPFDVIKTRMQINEQWALRGSIDIFKQILREEGLTKLFVGIQPRFFKVLLYGSMFFSTYEHFYALGQKYLDF